ncbi:unnamed protein product [Amaranthus hypochondriacus]
MQIVVSQEGVDSGGLNMEDQQQLTMRDNIFQLNDFDPISSVEFPISIQSNGNRLDNGGSNLNSIAMMTSNSVPQKRPRGRPKKIVHSLPEPLFVPSTPLKSSIEAIETWNTAKLLGIKSSNEAAVISQLRKSKRLLVLEENNPMGHL